MYCPDPKPPRGDAPRAILCGIVAAAITIGGCGEASPTPDGTAGLASGAPFALVPADATIDDANFLPRDPRTEEPDPNPRVAEQIILGFNIALDPEAFGAAEFVGNDLSCFSCHLNGGQREKALPLVGVAGLFPVYRGRDDRLVTLRERIDGCFKRSMNGTPPPPEHPVSLALNAYITWLSRGQPVGESPPWRGQNRIPEDSRLAIAELDVDRGQRLYAQRCAICHGADGQGVDVGLIKPAPLWGPRSWNDGAGASRIWTFAGFIRWAMPLNAPGTLSDEEAQHIAAYVNSHDRPVFPSKAADYPGGGRPGDAVYDTLVFPVHPLKRSGQSAPPPP